jgi:hypothetical protein
LVICENDKIVDVAKEIGKLMPKKQWEKPLFIMKIR